MFLNNNDKSLSLFRLAVDSGISGVALATCQNNLGFALV
jgi:hypothetical protein